MAPDTHNIKEKSAVIVEWWWCDGVVVGEECIVCLYVPVGCVCFKNTAFVSLDDACVSVG